jgi:hypothetical protein
VRDQQARHHVAIRDHSERRAFGSKTHQQDHRAIGTEPAVAHDFELCRDVAAATKAVGDIGQSILVQRPGQNRAAAERQRRGSEIRHPDRAQGEAEQSDGSTDQRADEWKHPVRAHEIFRRRALRMRHR